jgi:hypothetical protein
VTPAAPAQAAPAVQVQVPGAPGAVAPVPPPPVAIVPPPPQLDTALLVQAAEVAFVNEAKRLTQAKAFNTDKVTLSRARHGAELLIGLGPEFLPSSSAWTWSIGVETNPEPVAYCIPGGKIVVTTGFFERMRLTDDEYSALVAHAIAHALLGHDTVAAVADYDKRRDSTVPDPDVNRAALQLAESLMRVVTRPHYDGDEERAADAVALDMIARAGINPSVAIDAWRKVMRAGGTSAPGFLAMHPMRADRLAEIEAQLPRVTPMYQQAMARSRPAGAPPMPRR